MAKIHENYHKKCAKTRGIDCNNFHRSNSPESKVINKKPFSFFFLPIFPVHSWSKFFRCEIHGKNSWKLSRKCAKTRGIDCNNFNRSNSPESKVINKKPLLFFSSGYAVPRHPGSALLSSNLDFFHPYSGSFVFFRVHILFFSSIIFRRLTFSFHWLFISCTIDICQKSTFFAVGQAHSLTHHKINQLRLHNPQNTEKQTHRRDELHYWVAHLQPWELMTESLQAPNHLGVTPRFWAKSLHRDSESNRCENNEILCLIINYNKILVWDQ